MNDGRKFKEQPDNIALAVKTILDLTGGEALIVVAESGLEAFVPDVELSRSSFLVLGATMLTHSSENMRFRAIYKLSDNALREILNDEDQFRELEEPLQQILTMALGGSNGKDEV